MMAQKFWIITLLLGLAILGFASSVIGAFPEEGYNVLPGYGGPVFAFEMAKTQADLVAVFGPSNDPLRLERIAQMNRGNLLDFPFMVIYSLFMTMFCTAAWNETAKRIWLVFAGIGLLSGCADAVENVILLGLTANLEEAPHIAWLGIPVWTKFLSIMVCIIACGFYIATQSSVIWKVIGIAGILGGLMLFVAFLSPSQYGHLIRSGTTAGWMAMLLFAGYRWVKGLKEQRHV